MKRSQGHEAAQLRRFFIGLGSAGPLDVFTALAVGPFVLLAGACSIADVYVLRNNLIEAGIGLSGLNSIAQIRLTCPLPDIDVHLPSLTLLLHS